MDSTSEKQVPEQNEGKGKPRGGAWQGDIAKYNHSLY
jgi:hypothetical protein